jgi:hypothetical protein
MIVKVGAFREITDAVFYFNVTSRLSQNPSLPGSGKKEPEEHFDCSCFTGAIGSDKSENLPLLNLEIEITNGCNSVSQATRILLGESLDNYGFCHGHTPSILLVVGRYIISSEPHINSGSELCRCP